MDSNEINPNEINSNAINFNDIELKQDSSILLCGKRRSGKSVLVQNLVYEMCKRFEYNWIVVISNTALIDNSNFYRHLTNKIYTSDKMDLIIERILKFQKLKKTQGKQCYGIIILDDVNITQLSSSLQKLFSLGRHYNICIFLSVQFPKIICNIVR